MIGGPRCVVGLDVGSVKTCAVILEAPPGRPDRLEPPRVIGVGMAETEGVRHRAVTNIEAATQCVRDAVRDAENMAGLEVHTVYAGVAGAHIEVSSSAGVVAVTGPEIGQKEIDQVHQVARAVVIPPDRELLHAIPQDYTVDGHNGIQDPKGMEATRLESEVCIVTAGAPACQNLRKAIDRAGLSVEELVLAPLASNLAVLVDEDRSAGVAMIEVGGSTTEVLAFHEERLRLVASLPWAATTVSNDIVKGLGIPLAEAAALKERYGTAQTCRVGEDMSIQIRGPVPGSTREVSAGLLAHIIEQRLDEIFGLVYEELEERQLLGTLPAGIVLTGGGASLDGTVELAQEVFNMPVKLGLPGPGLDGLVDTVRDPGCATAVGLAVYGRTRELERCGGMARRTLGRVADWLRDFF